MNSQDPIAAGVLVVLSVAMLRALPVLLAFHTSDQPPRHQKAGALFAYCALVFVATRHAGLDVRDVLRAYAYLLLVCPLPYLLARRVPRAVLLALTLSVFLVLPAWFAPKHWLIALLGWDLAMASYSFCVDAHGACFSARRYVFFLFVNPTLAYPARGARVAPAQLSLDGVGRMLGGLATLFVSGSVNALAPLWAAHVPAALVVGDLVCRFSAMYLAHTGLASLQIGLMRQLGYVVPERYDRVLSARSPIEFWSRWNTYVATWARLYLFLPCMRWLLRRTSCRWRLPRAAAYGVAALATFTATGVLHELYGIVENRSVSPAVILWFTGNGLLLVVWHWSAQRLRGPAQRLGVRAQYALARGLALAMALLSATQLP